MPKNFHCYVCPKCLCLLRVCVCLNKGYAWFELSVRFNYFGQELFRKYWDHSLVFRDSIKFLVELNYVLMSQMPNPPLQMDSWTKCLEVYIFLPFLTKIKILLSFLFDVFCIDNIMYVLHYVKINSILKMNFLLNIDWRLSNSSHQYQE